MVDLDPVLVKLSKAHLPYWEGVEEDKRCPTARAHPVGHVVRIKRGQLTLLDGIIADCISAA